MEIPGLKPISRFFYLLYLKLVKIDDSPPKVSLGLALGVFSGIIPGTGPVAALFLAFILRANRTAALLGSLLTNTWLSVILFLFSVKAGAAVMQLNREEVYYNWSRFLKDFHLLDLFKLSALQVILPVIIGYFIVAFCSGFLSYLITLIILHCTKKTANSAL